MHELDDLIDPFQLYDFVILFCLGISGHTNYSRWLGEWMGGLMIDFEQTANFPQKFKHGLNSHKVISRIK